MEDQGDMREAIRRLNTHDRARLLRVAQRYSFGCSLTPEDLLQEAVLRALTGSRTAKDGLNLITFLAGAMRSIAFDERKKVTTHALDLATAIDVDAGDAMDSATQPDFTEALIADESNGARYEQLQNLVANNANAALVLEGLLDGMKPADIREALGLTPTEYESARTYIHRRIDAHFRKGPKP